MGVRELARRVAKEPAVRFVVLGAALFGAHAHWAGEQARPLSLDDAPRPALWSAFERERGRPPDPAERVALVEQWAQDEALLQHAYALRLHETDSVVRRRLVQDVEFLLEAETEPVTERAVRRRYRERLGSLVIPERRSFDHVFVAGEDALAEAEALRQRLAVGAEPAALGEPSSLGPRIEGVTRERLATRLGEALAEAAFALEPGRWSSPLPSALGAHLLRVTHVLEPAPRAFEDVAPELRAELAEEARAQAVAQGRAALRAQYVGDAAP